MIIVMKDLSESGTNQGETILCDGANYAPGKWAGPEGLSIDGEINVQVSEFLRADSAKVRNRKNHRVTVSFACKRDCGTVDAAEAFIVQFYATCKRGTQLVLATGSTAATKLTINNAALPKISLKHIGVMVQAQFSIIGGSIS